MVYYKVIIRNSKVNSLRLAFYMPSTVVCRNRETDILCRFVKVLNTPRPLETRGV